MEERVCVCEGGGVGERGKGTVCVCEGGGAGGKGDSVCV